MKRLLFILTIVSFSFYGCFKDTCRNVYTIYKPVYKKLSDVRSEMKTVPPQPIVNAGKIYTYQKYIFINEKNKGIHIIDNSNPSLPNNIGFIPIPGNFDMAIRGNYLYADAYSDLDVLDISDVSHAKPINFEDNIFKELNYFRGTNTQPDSVLVITDYIAKDTVVDCDVYQRWQSCQMCPIFVSGNAYFTSPNAGNGKGMGGSMARFTIANEFLYTVSNSTLYSFDLSNPSLPLQTASQSLGWNAETIYPLKNQLFIGSSSGMYNFDISNPSQPDFKGQFTHVKSCDPVIADSNYAFVTLRSGNSCQGFSNELDVIDISVPSYFSTVKVYPMTNPFGLSKSGSLLFICDGRDGLKIYNATDAKNLQLIKTFNIPDTYDIITNNGLALLVAKSGLYELNYNNPNQIKIIGHLSLTSK